MNSVYFSHKCNLRSLLKDLNPDVIMSRHYLRRPKYALEQTEQTHQNVTLNVEVYSGGFVKQIHLCLAVKTITVRNYVCMRL